ncbi:hypothetical protein ACFL5P_00050 [candidate division KSB1 bacterium]
MKNYLKKIRKKLLVTDPVIFTDAPYRIEPGAHVPVVCHVVNQESLPYTINKIRIELKKDGNILRSASALKKSVELTSFYWHKVILVPLPEDLKGFFEIDIKFEISINGKSYTILNDSYRNGHKPLRLLRAAEHLPMFENTCFGDIHYFKYANLHDEFSSHILPVSAEVAKALGLQFFAAADYKFDYPGTETVVLKSENGDNEWEKFRKDIDSWNRNNDFVILPAEEIRCKNLKGKDVDILIINYPEYISSSSAKSTLKSTSISIKELVSRAGSAAISVARKPEKTVSFLSGLFSRKGYWTKNDLTLEGLTGLQILSSDNIFFHGSGLERWIQILLKGKKKYIVTDSDARGNFSRPLNIPGLPTKKQKDINRYFGSIRTGLFCEPPFTKEKICSSLKNGNSVITNGPLMEFSVRNEFGGKAIIGKTIKGSVFHLKYRAVSTSEFGSLKTLKIYCGYLSSKKEECIYSKNFSREIDKETGELVIEPPGKTAYLRGELISGKSPDNGFCLTNPIWINSSTF